MENKNNKKKIGIAISAITVLVICFCISYFVTDYMRNQEKARIKEEQEEEKTVYNQLSKVVKDSATVILKTEDKIDTEEQMSALKERLNLTGDVTKEMLSEVLGKQGYKIDEMSDMKYIFKRSEEDSNNVEPNKFFIGEKDGFLAVYKSDESGKLAITSEKDVFRDKKRLKDLPEREQNKIKNFEFMYDTREKAIEDITELIS